MAKREFIGVNWQYCTDPNDIDDAICNRDEDWEGLTDASDIISITYDTNHGCYVVFWKYHVQRGAENE